MPTSQPQFPSTENELSILKKQLKNELNRNILLEESEKNYWLEQLPNLNLTTTKNILNLLTPKNQLIDHYIEKTLSKDQNQEHLKQLKSQIANLKKTAFQIEEQSESSQENQEFENLLNKLN